MFIRCYLYYDDMEKNGDDDTDGGRPIVGLMHNTRY
jgi:hypothetical protein